MKTKPTDLDKSRDIHPRIILTSLKNTNNIQYHHSLPISSIYNARHKLKKSSFQLEHQHKQSSNIIHATIHSTNNKSSNAKEPVFSIRLSKDLPSLDHRDKPIINRNSIKSLTNISLHQQSSSPPQIQNILPTKTYEQERISTINNYSFVKTNETDFKSLYKQKRIKNKKRRYFKSICLPCSPLCLCLWLFCLLLLAIGIAALLVALITMFNSTTTTTILVTTTTSTTTTTDTTTTTTSTSSTTTTTTSTTTTTTTTPCDRFPTETTYSTGSGSHPYYVSVGNVDGDGDRDIVAANYGSGNVSVFLNIGNGTFAPQVTYSAGNGSQLWSVALADVDGDGKLDIIVPNYTANNIGVFLNSGTGTFAAQVTYPSGVNPISVAASDVNGDSKPDIIVANAGAGTVGVFLNSGTGTFGAQVAYSTLTFLKTLTVADVNGDGKNDIIVTNFNVNNVGVLLNAGTGTFAAQVTYATDAYPYAVTTGDVDGNGKLDIIVTNYLANVGILINNGTGTFGAQITYSTDSYAMSVATADIDGDSTLDIIVGNYISCDVSVLLNTGTGTFDNQTTYSTGIGSNPLSVAAVDLNGDNKPDIIVANSHADNVGVFLNNC
ncbi:unnamed protein product [Adineta steineri]|uniref:Uncharacterized protein n=1 Tax=Adineta steineri TaxID=433720 RepID=A0A813PHT3_9BILA|nr:unnamed protein product [Adineta steineri]CAF4108624.1 unnamed protein product [Adineta steineri]